MTGARAAILARLQAQQVAESEWVVNQRFSAPPVTGRITPLEEQTPVARFLAQAQSLKSDVLYVHTSAVVAGVADYLQQRNLPLTVVTTIQSTAYNALAWDAAGIRIVERPAQADDAVGMTGCMCAIAETGTVLLTSGEKTPLTPSLLPATHIVLLHQAQIVPAMEDAWTRLRQQYPDGLPCACHFISGPSRTGDIEQTLTLGAHGPARVLLVVIADD